MDGVSVDARAARSPSCRSALPVRPVRPRHGAEAFLRDLPRLSVQLANRQCPAAPVVDLGWLTRCGPGQLQQRQSADRGLAELHTFVNQARTGPGGPVLDDERSTMRCRLGVRVPEGQPSEGHEEGDKVPD
jgi:hypothetical protein